MAYKGKQLDYSSEHASYWENELFDPDTQLNSQDPSLIQGTKFNCIFTRTVAAGLTEDAATFGLHLTMRPGGAGVSDNLNSTDMGAAENQFKTAVWTPIRHLISQEWTFKEFQWRDFGADFPLTEPEDPIKNPPTIKYGPARRITPVGEAGSSVNPRLPDQVALTVTFRTPAREHWGRVYLGGFHAASDPGASFGHAAPANVDLIAAAFDQFFRDISGFVRILEPVVWSARYGGMMSVSTLAVDNTFDVIRRRRAKYPSYRKIYS